MTPGTYKTHEVAARLGVTLPIFQRERPALEQRGFPPPIIEHTYRRANKDGRIIVVTRALWARQQVEGWLEAVAHKDGRAHQVIEHRRMDLELASRAAALAARMADRTQRRRAKR